MHCELQYYCVNKFRVCSGWRKTKSRSTPNPRRVKIAKKSSCGVSEQGTDELQGAADLTNQTRAQTVHCLLNNGKEKQKGI